MSDLLRRIWEENEGQDIAEYAVMLAVVSGDCGWDSPADWLERQQRFLGRCR